MPYGTDATVFVEDVGGDLGAPQSPAPWWVSPDVDIPAHSGEAVQGVNQVQVRVHAHEEPILSEKIVAEVYVGKPGFVLSPSVGTVRIDPNDPNLLVFRTVDVPGSEPVANTAGATISFDWTPSSSVGAINGPGHRCLIVRAFPVDVIPPSDPFDVHNEQHEAQHNLEILTTTTASASMGRGGAGTRRDPRRRDEDTGMWWEQLVTRGVGKKGRRFVVWAFDPKPSKQLVAGIRKALSQAKLTGFSAEPPAKVTLEPVKAAGEEIDPGLLKGEFAERAGLGTGLFAKNRLVGAAELELSPRRSSGVLLRFDHSNLKERTAVVLHGVQWSEDGTAEGGMTIVALAPTDP